MIQFLALVAVVITSIRRAIGFGGQHTDLRPWPLISAMATMQEPGLSLSSQVGGCISGPDEVGSMV
jgi:hypothetical protein